MAGDGKSSNLESSFYPVKEPPGIDIHLVTLTPLVMNLNASVGLIVHRSHLDSCFPSHLLHLHQSKGKVSVVVL